MQALRRIELSLRRALRAKIVSSHDMWALLKRAHRVRNGLHGFCQTLQTYVMFDAIEGGWSTFTKAIEQVGMAGCLNHLHFGLVQACMIACRHTSHYTSVVQYT